MNPREMTFAHQYSEAAKIYETQLESKPEDPGLLAGYASALFALERFEEALKCASQANAIESAQMRGETQPYIKMIGSILWILGRRDEAIQTFRTAVDGVLNGSIKYADNAGGVSQGVLLWYAGVMAADEDSISRCPHTRS
jgi:tetratricopeptide (TPR) repeat protein